MKQRDKEKYREMNKEKQRGKTYSKCVIIGIELQSNLLINWQGPLSSFANGIRSNEQNLQ